MTIATHQIGDFLKDPKRQPDWAQLTRLGGDRVALLFEELRRRVSVIDGLVEELIYQGPEPGWTPRYRCGETSLFSVIVRPGTLEAVATLDRHERQRALGSTRVTRKMKQRIRDAPVEAEPANLKMPLAKLEDIRAFARLMVLKSQKTAVTPTRAMQR
ncbi:MAG TPA: hypothetical protein VJV74_02260 [Terriglobia bacterium]|nr:hypothetical protein [Terriglobia bacterium]